MYMFNSSLNSATFPEPWKKAKGVPLFKGGNREDVGSFRPVSLLPLPGKLLEKIVHDRISNFWTMNNFLSEEQGAFRKGFSTLSKIVNLTATCLIKFMNVKPLLLFLSTCGRCSTW